MKKSLLILLFGLCACKTGFDYSSKKCVEKDQRIALEKAVELFESKIQKQYPKLPAEAAYFEFISDWSNKKLNKDFYNDSLEWKIRNLNIWTESVRSEKNMDLEKKLFNVDSMNPVRVKLNIEFSTCLYKTKDRRKGINSFILINSKHRISPKNAQKFLYRANENDLKKFENRLAIVLGVYYQTMFNIKNTVANNTYKSIAGGFPNGNP